MTRDDLRANMHAGLRRRYKLLFRLYLQSLTMSIDEHYWSLLKAAWRDMIDADNGDVEPRPLAFYRSGGSNDHRDQGSLRSIYVP